jgi:Tfp pilus assembly protein PilX
MAHTALPPKPHAKPSVQRAAALLLCLVLLTALTLLGLAAASDQRLQIRISGNMARAAEARIAAEEALSWAEAWLLSLPGGERPVACRADCAAGQVIQAGASLPAGPERTDPQWWTDRGHQAGQDPVDGEILDPRLASLQAAWVISEIAVPAEYTDGLEVELGYYRVIARGVGVSGREPAIVESIMARPWGDDTWSDALPPYPGQTGLCQRYELEPCGRLAWRRLR